MSAALIVQMTYSAVYIARVMCKMGTAYRTAL